MAMEQRRWLSLFAQERSGKTSSLNRQLFSSNEKSNDGIIRVVPSRFRVVTGIWNTGQEEQGVGSDSADLNYESVAQKVADHSRGDKAEQRTFERSVGNSSFSLLAELRANRLKAIKAMEQTMSRLESMLIVEKLSVETSLKGCLKGQLFSSNEKSNDPKIKVLVPSYVRVATGIWNSGQEEQGVGSDSADLNYESVAQKVADHSRGDKAEQRTFERSVGNSSFSLLAELRPSRLKAIKAMEQERSRLKSMLIVKKRSGETSLKRSSKRQLFSSNEKSNDPKIKVLVPSYVRVATGLWNTGQEEQGVSSDSAHLYYDSTSQNIRDHVKGDKAEQRTFEQSGGNSSSSNAAAVRGSKRQDDDGDDDVLPLTETPPNQGKGATGNQEYPPLTYAYLHIFSKFVC